MGDYLGSIALEMGISTWLLVVILVWTFSWKLCALWKSARKGSLVWFGLLAVLNTIGILEILYIFVFSKMNFKKSHFARTKKTRKKKR